MTDTRGVHWMLRPMVENALGPEAALWTVSSGGKPCVASLRRLLGDASLPDRDLSALLPATDLCAPLGDARLAVVLAALLPPASDHLRWEVEQFFKLTEPGSGLHDMPSANENILKAFIYAALCRATVSMRGRRTVQAILGGERACHLHALTWHRLWLHHAHAALRSMLPPPARLRREDLRRLCAEANPARWCTLTSFADAA